jgi:hypothetical protein
MHPNTLARALGWFSIALGAAELAAPRRLARASGMDEDRSLMVRACGAREVFNGVALLRSMDPEPYLWLRVAGDAMDLAGVGMGAWRRSSGRTRAGVALAVLAGVTAVDVMAARSLRRRQTQRPVRDYSARSGFPRPVEQMRGAAQQALKRPADPPLQQPSDGGPTMHGPGSGQPGGMSGPGAVH